MIKISAAELTGITLDQIADRLNWFEETVEKYKDKNEKLQLQVNGLISENDRLKLRAADQNTCTHEYKNLVLDQFEHMQNPPLIARCRKCGYIPTGNLV